MERNTSKVFSDAHMEDIRNVGLAKSGDASAFARIHRKYAPFLRQHVYLSVRDRHLAEDIVQDIMAKVWSNLDKYRVDRTFNTWFWRIAKNHLVDCYRRSGKNALDCRSNLSIRQDNPDSSETVSGFVLEEALEDPSSSSDGRLLDKETKEFVRSVLGSVSPRERRILEMYFFEEKSYKEIADELEVPLNTMKVALMRAKESVRSLKGAMVTASVLLG